MKETIMAYPECECKKCNHRWQPRVKKVKACPKCKSYSWNKSDKDALQEHSICEARKETNQ